MSKLKMWIFGWCTWAALYGYGHNGHGQWPMAMALLSNNIALPVALFALRTYTVGFSSSNIMLYVGILNN